MAILLPPRSQDTAVASDTTGIDPPMNRKIDIVFHVLIPPNIWGWNDKCHVHLRFGHTHLGKWEKNIGDFSFMR